MTNWFRNFQSILIFLLSVSAFGQTSPRTIHVFVALCDNEHQGIVPVPSKIGNGEDPKNNLYWGALYGLKTYFRKSNDWKLIENVQKTKDVVLERCVFKHEKRNVYLVADAYRGREIRQTVVDFLDSASGNKKESISIDSQKVTLRISGGANVVAYVGHNGLMDFHLDTYPKKANTENRDAIILACASKPYFSIPLRKAGANPILWTTGLMCPEAYTLKSAIDGWILNETTREIGLRAAKAYHKYQKCSLDAAKRLFDVANAQD